MATFVQIHHLSSKSGDTFQNAQTPRKPSWTANIYVWKDKMKLWHLENVPIDGAR